MLWQYISNLSMEQRQRLISVKKCCVAESRSIDQYLGNSNEIMLKVMAGLEELYKDKIKSKNNHKKNGTI